MKKRAAALLLALSLALALTACAKSEAAQAVDDQIEAIGEVTLESEAAITAAEEAVEALAEEDREQLDNVDVLEQARADYENLVLEAQAAEVEEAIRAIGTVTLDSADAVASARSLYDSSSAEVQALVENAADLESAEAELSNLQVEEVTGLINAIGTVSLDSADAIEAAQALYDTLPEETKAQVTNAAALESASAQLKTLKQEQAQQLLSAMRLEEDKIRGMRFYYPSAWRFYSNGNWAADIRCFILPYLGQNDSETWLRLVYNYTGDDWVFFDTVIVAADDERFTRSFSYFDITRDNGGGDVWEYIDTDVGASDIEMLWAIANSTETLVRFQGDDYSRDFTITDADKQAIRDALTASEALQ